MANPIPPANHYPAGLKKYDVRPGGPAGLPTYIASASEGGALNVRGSLITNSSDGKTVKVTPLKSFALQFTKGAIGSETFYYNMPKMVPSWLRTQLVSAGLVS
jgi:hypothetical protein